MRPFIVAVFVVALLSPSTASALAAKSVGTGGSLVLVAEKKKKKAVKKATPKQGETRGVVPRSSDAPPY